MKTPIIIVAGIFLGTAIFFAGHLANRQNDPAVPSAFAEQAAPHTSPVHSSASESVKTAKDPVCGMTVDPKAASTLKTQYKGETYYFCSETCKKSFEANPEKYTPKKTSPAKTEDTKDPVCGMKVDPNSDKTLKTQYKGRTYYFCSGLCKRTFEANPGEYVHTMANEGNHGNQKAK